MSEITDECQEPRGAVSASEQAFLQSVVPGLEYWTRFLDVVRDCEKRGCPLPGRRRLAKLCQCSLRRAQRMMQAWQKAVAVTNAGVTVPKDLGVTISAPLDGIPQDIVS